MVLPRANRHWPILLILAPVVLVYGLLLLFEQIGLDSSSAAMLSVLSQSTAVATAVWWLLMPSMQPLVGASRFLLAGVILAAVAALGIPSYSSEWSGEVAVLLGMFALFSLILISATVIAAKFVRNQYRPVALFLWLTLMIWPLSILGMLVLMFVVALGQQSLPGFSEVLVVVFIGGIFWGIWVYMHILPFLILTLATTFFRQRFKAFLQLSSSPT